VQRLRSQILKIRRILYMGSKGERQNPATILRSPKQAHWIQVLSTTSPKIPSKSSGLPSREVLVPRTSFKVTRITKAFSGRAAESASIGSWISASPVYRCPGNGHGGPRSKRAPRLTWRAPRNGSDGPRNAKIVPGSVFAPRKDTTVPGNASIPNQHFRVSLLPR
jgi:hypothetical protein